VLRYLRKRILSGAIPLVAVMFGVFFLTRLTGDPALLYLPINATPEMRHDFTVSHGFDQPIIVQMGDYLWKAVHLNLGTSLSTGEDAVTMALRAFPITLQLAGVTLLVAILGAIVIGSTAAFRPNGWADRLVSFFSTLGASLPDFWIALIGIAVFAVVLRILPTSGMDSPASWVLPVATLVIRPLGVLTQVVRGAMVSALSAPYVKLARSKGATEFRVVTRHALRNAAAPALTVAGDIAVGLVNGAVVVETIFGWPGIGNLMITAVLNDDFAVVQAAVFVTTIAIFALNIFIDVCYALLDARVRVPAKV
jgi:peptide/nickel transport system permease protein